MPKSKKPVAELLIPLHIQEKFFMMSEEERNRCIRQLRTQDGPYIASEFSRLKKSRKFAEGTIEFHHFWNEYVQPILQKRYNDMY